MSASTKRISGRYSVKLPGCKRYPSVRKVNAVRLVMNSIAMLETSWSRRGGMVGLTSPTRIEIARVTGFGEVMRTNRVLVSALLLLFLISASMCKNGNDSTALRQQRKVMAEVRAGVEAETVLARVGQPTFIDSPLIVPFIPSDLACRANAVKALVYQSRHEKTVVVYVNAQGRVECIEQTPSFRLVHR